MEELKLLVEMVAHLPQTALWVLIGFFVYKVVVIGSIYGVIRLAIVKLHDWLTGPRSLNLAGMCISGEIAKQVEYELARLVQHRGRIYSMEVADLRKAVDIVIKERTP